jgi:hypothetical protein
MNHRARVPRRTSMSPNQQRQEDLERREELARDAIHWGATSKEIAFWIYLTRTQGESFGWPGDPMGRLPEATLWKVAGGRRRRHVQGHLDWYMEYGA